MDEHASAGCVVPSRLLGVVEAKQTRGGKTSRNDLVIGISVSSHHYRGVEMLHDLDLHPLDEMERFFVVYNQLQGRTFKPLGR